MIDDNLGVSIIDTINSCKNSRKVMNIVIDSGVDYIYTPPLNMLKKIITKGIIYIV